MSEVRSVPSVEFPALDPDLPETASEEEWADHYAHKCELMRERVLRAAAWLEEVGNDYSGSSCQEWCATRAAALRNSLKSCATESVYLFWHRRPTDKQAWPVVYQDAALAESCPFRVSDVVRVPMPSMRTPDPRAKP